MPSASRVRAIWSYDSEIDAGGNGIGLRSIVQCGTQYAEGGSLRPARFLWSDAEAVSHRGCEGRGALRRIQCFRDTEDPKRAHAPIEDRLAPCEAPTPERGADLLHGRRTG